MTALGGRPSPVSETNSSHHDPIGQKCPKQLKTGKCEPKIGFDGNNSYQWQTRPALHLFRHDGTRRVPAGDPACPAPPLRFVLLPALGMLVGGVWRRERRGRARRDPDTKPLCD